ncbi:MAPK-interacting and spindle-stabilizing protein-like [Camelus ferus]|uniref:MAPK-interacting and spindle-stabilizing protein-like n=1 Tax=Camelus ferus TaxID=419612 RepID=A0A8B8UJ35_CAMFR|nr:MAPK-interacting and spindle-stabilizing protein-like [Camelus ferus]
MSRDEGLSLCCPPREFGRRGREDHPRCAAVTGSNPARGALGRVNNRTRPAAAGKAPRATRPITLSPSNAHSSAAIGSARTPPAPDWLRWRMWPQYDPQSDPKVAQARPVPLPPRAMNTWPTRPRRWGRPREAWGAERKSEDGGDAAPAPPPAPPPPESPAPQPSTPPGRVPAHGPGSWRQRAASPHWRRRAWSRGAAPTLIGLGGAAKLSAHVACPRGDGRG